jgi:hypothetical protein
VTNLDTIKADLASKPKELQDKISQTVVEATKHLKWIPSPGPQMIAYQSKADVMLYGGEPGGGKTDLILGLAFNEHKRALIMRRRYTDLSAIVDRMIEINGSRSGFNGAPPPSLKNGQVSIELGAAANVGDEQNWIGRARDFLGIDEATQFAEQQVRLLMGWVRTTVKGQRTRVVLATNPPLSSEGVWVMKMFAPWLDDTFSNPAKPGELRWVITDGDEGDKWVDGPGTYQTLSGRMVNATSRTYVPSSVTDNPFLSESGYQDTLDALPEPIRQILMGGFRAQFRDAPNQIIPTAWIREAQKRWTPYPPHGIPMCAMGVDPSGGGDDPMCIAMRYDGYFAPLIEIQGKTIPKDRIGSYTAAMVLTHQRDRAPIVIDMGGGYGGACYESLKEKGIDVVAYKGAEKSVTRTRDRQMGFANVRSEALWAFREALNPDQDGGSPIALPDDPILVADLTAPTLDPDLRFIKAEPKEDVNKRLGRSTNRADAVIMAWFKGPRRAEWDTWVGRRIQTLNRLPQVLMGRAHGRDRR